MHFLLWITVTIAVGTTQAEIREFSGGNELPHEKYVRTIPESESPVERVYIKSKDGLYVAAAIRKPKGNGPFPALIHFHGAPGGRGMEQLVGWARGDHGSPVFERFLREGYTVVVADYRGGLNLRRFHEQPDPEAITYVDDAVAVTDYVGKLPYVDPQRLHVYGVSLGGDVTMHLITRVQVRAAVLGAPAPMRFLGAQAQGQGPDRFKNLRINQELAEKNAAAVRCPVLILVGTADSLIGVDRPLHDYLEKAGKRVRMEIYANGYHDFVIGPQGQAGRKEPLLDITLTALENTLQFLRDPAK
jgi:dipeptidyl aminopeptidase/acylaminoacyl peptidase